MSGEHRKRPSFRVRNQNDSVLMFDMIDAYVREEKHAHNFWNRFRLFDSPCQ